MNARPLSVSYHIMALDVLQMAFFNSIWRDIEKLHTLLIVSLYVYQQNNKSTKVYSNKNCTPYRLLIKFTMPTIRVYPLVTFFNCYRNWTQHGTKNWHVTGMPSRDTYGQ